MKTSFIVTCLSCLLILAALVGCQGTKPAADTQATVNAAIQATSTAQANLAATVDAAVKATAAAQPTLAATPTQPKTTAPGATVASATKAATPALAATPTPSVSYVTMTEEELAALIDQAVKEATAATNTANTTTTTATADGTVTAQEVQAMQASVTTAQTEIAQALALTQAYYDLYGEVATETLSVLKAIEQDLNSMATSMNTMAQSLQQMNQTLSQGLTLTQSMIAQLESYATKASQAVASAQTKAKSWTSTVQSELNKRATTALDTKPTNVPTDLRGTAQSVNTYIETIKSALGDNKISQKELSAISAAGANATAGLKQFGGAEGQALSNSIDNMTKQLARGEAPKAKNSLGALEQSAKSLPSLPSGLPQPPQPRR